MSQIEKFQQFLIRFISKRYYMEVIHFQLKILQIKEFYEDYNKSTWLLQFAR